MHIRCTTTRNIEDKNFNRNADIYRCSHFYLIFSQAELPCSKGINEHLLTIYYIDYTYLTDPESICKTSQILWHSFCIYLYAKVTITPRLQSSRLGSPSKTSAEIPTRYSKTWPRNLEILYGWRHIHSRPSQTEAQIGIWSCILIYTYVV